MDMDRIEGLLADVRNVSDRLPGDEDLDWEEVAERNAGALSQASRDALSLLTLGDVRRIALSGNILPAGMDVVVFCTALPPFAWRRILMEAARGTRGGDLSAAVLSTLLRSGGLVEAATGDFEVFQHGGRPLDDEGHLRHTLLNIGGTLSSYVNRFEAATLEAERLKLELERLRLEQGEQRRAANEALDDFGVPGSVDLAGRYQAALHRPPSYDRGGRGFLDARRRFADAAGSASLDPVMAPGWRVHPSCWAP